MMRSCTVRWSMTPVVSQFSGTRLTRRWARQFILGSRLWQQQGRTERSSTANHSTSVLSPSVEGVRDPNVPKLPHTTSYADQRNQQQLCADSATADEVASAAAAADTSTRSAPLADGSCIATRSESPVSAQASVQDEGRSSAWSHASKNMRSNSHDEDESERANDRCTSSGPTRPDTLSHTTTDSAEAARQAQQLLSKVWSLPIKPLDATSEQRIVRLLARYAAGEGLLEDEVLQDFNTALQLLPPKHYSLGCSHANKSDDAAGVPHVEDPRQMLQLLQSMRCIVEGDNIHRTSYEGRLHYSAQAESLMTPFLDPALRQPGADVWDRIREIRTGPAYAIDSITTSEVDDAIGVHIDEQTGQEYFVVYVSDATVYCPFGSPLEECTARYLATTTYLPEEVFFMLPKPIVELATLREDCPCRTFNVRFQIHPTTGELYNYSVHVGWLNKLRRITYDSVQRILASETTSAGDTNNDKDRGNAMPRDNNSAYTSHDSSNTTNNADDAASQPPSWLTATDVSALRKIYTAAQVRFAARMRRRSGMCSAHSVNTPGLSRGSDTHRRRNSDTRTSSSSSSSNPTGVDATTLPSNTENESCDSRAAELDISLPDPLIRVCGTRVLSLTDQVVRTHDARLAVAELMIAANEICSRVAQEQRVTLPFRGTRDRSSEHEVADYFVEPGGVHMEQSLDSGHLFFAEAMQNSVRRLSSVTRAIYCHEPLFHSGLWTSHYAHSTSPLRRYADMLVHHQLKLWLWERHGGTHRCPSSAHTFAHTSPSPNVRSSLRGDDVAHDDLSCPADTMGSCRGGPAAKHDGDGTHTSRQCEGSRAGKGGVSRRRALRLGRRARNRSASRGPVPAVLLEPPIPEYTMAALCANINERQEQSSLLQNSSTRFWTLRYVEDMANQRRKAHAGSAAVVATPPHTTMSSSASLLRQQQQQQQQCRNLARDGKQLHSPSTPAEYTTCNMRRRSQANISAACPFPLRFLCLLGQTRRVRGSPEYDRFCSNAEESIEALMLAATHSASHNNLTLAHGREQPPATVPCEGRWRQPCAEYVYVSDVYIPELQLAHTMTHSCAAARVGAVVECAVRYVHAATGVLELELCGVCEDGDERDFLRLWMGGVVSSLDA